MCRFIETIQVRDGKLQNLAHHNRRMNETRQAVFGMVDQLDILNYIEDCPESGFYKCRVVYGREVCEVAFSAYTMRTSNRKTKSSPNITAYSTKMKNSL